jgi:hypothetical protein
MVESVSQLRGQDICLMADLKVLSLGLPQLVVFCLPLTLKPPSLTSSLFEQSILHLHYRLQRLDDISCQVLC